MQGVRFIKFLPAIVWFIFTAVLVFLPGSDIPQASWLDFIYFDKYVHVGIFGGITFLFCLPFFKAQISLHQKIDYFIRISLAVILWGIIVEVIQRFFVPGRSFDLLDWAADSTGTYVAFLISRKISHRFSGKNLK
jgi:VanZ family protein